jgi:exopolyphosphatase/pppGpp-phosphohydrolase
MVCVVGATAVVADLCGTAPEKAAESADARCIELDRLTEWVQRLWRMKSSERQALRGLPSDRSDTILAGAFALEHFTQRLGFHRFQFSSRGVRYGALLDAPGQPQPLHR